nr:unnamed protein product [Digitaria exilis]
MPYMEELTLSYNNLAGEVSADVTVMRNLREFILAYNNFSGEIPQALGLNTTGGLQRVDLTGNRFHGAIPPGLCTGGRLAVLDLGQNQFTGAIPSEILKCQSLWRVLLWNNQLSGSLLPSDLEINTGCSVVNFSGNLFEGRIPSVFGSWHNLTSFDLSSNKFSGRIPNELGALSRLGKLSLSSNMLSGPIPNAFTGTQGLLELQLGGNSLEGPIPESLVHYMVKRSRRLLAKHVSVRGLDTTEELPEDLTYDDILRATDNWSEKYVIGRGRHGTVYRTEFAPGRQWAVKTVDLSQFKFPIEMKILNMVKHRNIVKMEGYCIRGNVGIILSEYMPQGNLFELLHGRKPQVALDWNIRHQITLGIAQGLSYLHHDCVPMIVHRDVKSSNILMDADLVPKITDFGMGKIVYDEDADATVSVIVGTLGYIAPEHGYNTRLTEKSDVYSYGVVLLELLCRKMPVGPAFGDGVDIVAWITSKLKCTDPCGVMSCMDEEIMYWPGDEQAKALDLLDLAMACTQVAFQSRPSMREVVSTLMRIEDNYIANEEMI